MPQPLIAPMPPDLDLPDGYVVQWAAISPTDGSTVAGVKIKNVSIFGTMIGAGGSTSVPIGPFMLVPGPGA